MIVNGFANDIYYVSILINNNLCSLKYDLGNILTTFRCLHNTENSIEKKINKEDTKIAKKIFSKKRKN